MSLITIWNGTSNFSSSYSSGSETTPFKFYDTDPVFRIDADKVAHFCTSRLGYPMMDVELQDINLWACFEEAITTYGNEVFQWKIRENYLNMEGGLTGSSVNNTLINPNLNRVVQISQNYGTEAGVGGNVTRYSGSIELEVDKQTYDLGAWAQTEGITGGIEVRRVFYEAPPAILRYFDPYAGTGTGLQSLMDAFDFGSYSPGVNFLLMPTSFDVSKIQAIEFNDQIRRSSYSFEIINNVLKIFPIPRSSGKLWFQYFRLDDKALLSTNSNKGLVTNVGEVPYSNPIYGHINSVGRQWIFRYTLALARETLAYVRGKYTSVPVPGSEATLNQADLLADARSEKAALLENLRDMLDQTSRDKQLERKANESEYLNRTLGNVPMTIYIG